MQLLLLAHPGEVALQQAQPFRGRRDLDVCALDLLAQEVDLARRSPTAVPCGVSGCSRGRRDRATTTWSSARISRARASASARGVDHRGAHQHAVGRDERRGGVATSASPRPRARTRRGRRRAARCWRCRVRRVGVDQRQEPALAGQSPSARAARRDRQDGAVALRGVVRALGRRRRRRRRRPAGRGPPPTPVPYPPPRGPGPSAARSRGPCARPGTASPRSPPGRGGGPPAGRAGSRGAAGCPPAPRSCRPGSRRSTSSCPRFSLIGAERSSNLSISEARPSRSPSASAIRSRTVANASLTRARSRSLEVIERCSASISARRPAASSPIWRRASSAASALLLGDVERTLGHLQLAFAHAPGPR